MNETIRLGRIRGIRVGANWSVLVIGWLLVWALADTTLPEEAPGAADIWYWVAAVLAVIVFWAGLLAHELAHALVATRHDVEVDGITLWLFGGVSRLRGDAATPSAELRIALAGPATSLAIAALFGATAGALALLGFSDLVVATLAWLALINALLAIFNLMPAAPLDGGRVLHAIVWRRSGSRVRATEVATGSGTVFGYGLVGLGVILLGSGNLMGVWFAFLGWFLLNAARAEATHVLVHEALAEFRVRDVMTGDPVTVPADITIEDLLHEHLLRQRWSAYPVVDAAGDVTGLITLQQVKSVHPGRRSELRAADVAWPAADVPSAAPDEPLIDLVDRVARGAAGDGRALVFTGGRLCGIVSPTDLQRALEMARLQEPTSPPPPAAPPASAPEPHGTK
jgi:Zn-dependent protease